MSALKDLLLEKQVETKESTFDYFDANNYSKLQAKNQTTERELSRFKNDYDSKKLNRVYDKYNLYENADKELTLEDYYNDMQASSFIEEEPFELKAKKTFTSPTRNTEFNKLIREQNKFEEVEDTLTYKKIERNPKVKLNLNQKTKLMVFTYSFVTVMLAFLLIYNAFSISNLNDNINAIQNNIATKQVNIERVIKDIGNMTDEDNVLDVAEDLSFSEIPVENIVTIELYEKAPIVSYEGQTNWFDSICNFLSNLFGG